MIYIKINFKEKNKNCVKIESNIEVSARWNYVQVVDFLLDFSTSMSIKCKEMDSNYDVEKRRLKLFSKEEILSSITLTSSRKIKNSLEYYLKLHYKSNCCSFLI